MMLPYTENIQAHLIGKYNFFYHFSYSLCMTDDLTRFYIWCRFHKRTNPYFHYKLLLLLALIISCVFFLYVFIPIRHLLNKVIKFAPSNLRPDFIELAR